MSPAESGRSRILLVTDGEGSLDAHGDALAAAGFRVTTVGSAGACLTRLESDGVDGVVSAHALPDLDGIRLLRSVRISHPSLPFFLVPSDGSESLAGEALAAGASGYVPRDADPGTLVARLGESIERAAAAGEDEEHGRYRHLIELSPAAINVFDESGESIWCNRATVDLLDLDSREALIGDPVLSIVHPDDRDTAREEIASVVERGVSTGPTLMKLRTPDGDPRFVQVATAVGSFLGESVGQAIAVDVTEREERERQLEMLDQWLRHNVRNETTVIRGLAEDIARGSTDDVAESAARICDHATRLVEQADHERRLITLLSARDESERVTLDVGAAVRRQVAACRERHPEASVAVTAADAFETTAVPELEDALRELVENAVEHNDTRRPTVEVAVERPTAARGVVCVADDGPPIPDVERDGLSLDAPIDQLHHASGLGLTLVRWAVRLSGGEVSFDRNEPRGNVVTLSLPVAE
jgi:PAS domain S-box-containing protein